MIMTASHWQSQDANCGLWVKRRPLYVTFPADGGLSQPNSEEEVVLLLGPCELLGDDRVTSEQLSKIPRFLEAWYSLSGPCIFLSFSFLSSYTGIRTIFP